jgi:hypothetical protein
MRRRRWKCQTMRRRKRFTINFYKFKFIL